MILSSQDIAAFLGDKTINELGSKQKRELISVLTKRMEDLIPDRFKVLTVDQFQENSRCMGEFYTHSVLEGGSFKYAEIRFIPNDSVEGYSECIFRVNDLFVADLLLMMLHCLERTANPSPRQFDMNEDLITGGFDVDDDPDPVF